MMLDGNEDNEGGQRPNFERPDYHPQPVQINGVDFLFLVTWIRSNFCFPIFYFKLGGG
jgi:hypothetical protein